jgi:hypothetical protein
LSSDGPGKISDGQPQVVAEANAELVNCLVHKSEKQQKTRNTKEGDNKRKDFRRAWSDAHFANRPALLRHLATPLLGCR